MAVVACVPSLPAAAIPTPSVVPSWCERTSGGYRCMVGPVDVPADEMVEFVTGVAAPSEAGYITSARATLVDGDGNPVPHHMVHLHHAVWLNPMKRDLTCDSYDGGFPAYDRFFATGKERTKLDLPSGHGYYWSNEAPQPYTQSAPWWALVAHLDGMHGNSDTYIRLDLGFVSADEAKGFTNVRPVWLDVRNCSSEPEYDVRKGSGSGGIARETWRYRMPIGGRFVFVGGHLHDGGRRLVLDNSASGKRIFVSRAHYGMDDEPWYLTAMTTWTGTPGRRVAKGDRLKLTAVYDSTRSWRRVMGIMVGALVRGD